MMRSLLAKHIAHNVSRSIKSNECMFDGQQCYTHITTGTTCVDLGNRYGYVFKSPVTVIDQNNKETKDVYMLVGGCYKFSQAIAAGSYYRVESSREFEEEGIRVNYEMYFVSKPEADLNLKYEGERSGSTAKVDANRFYVYNPNKFSAEADFDNQYVDQNNEPIDKRLSKENPKITDVIYGSFGLEPDESANSVSISLKIKISGNDPGNFPQKTWKVQHGIFTKDTEDDDLPGSGLSAGEIAGIVIACVVVVAIIVFLIVWFVVLKKKCCCGKKVEKSKSSSSSSSK